MVRSVSCDIPIIYVSSRWFNNECVVISGSWIDVILRIVLSPPLVTTIPSPPGPFSPTFLFLPDIQKRSKCVPTCFHLVVLCTYDRNQPRNEFLWSQLFPESLQRRVIM
jgi:hypothetical protein